MRVIDLGRIHRLRLTAGLITAVICLLHWFLPQQPVDGVGTLSLLSPLYTVLLSVLVVVIASGLGRLALGVLAPNEDCDPLESLVFSFGLGMALVGFGVYALGLAGLFRPEWIAVFLIVVAVISTTGVVRLRRDARIGLDLLRGDWGRARVGWLLMLGLVGSIAILSLLIALAPPWAYDGLMYHLQAPRLFLQQGRIVSLPGILQANGPLLGQMLFSIGLALGSDTFSQVIHLTFAAALFLAVLAAGRRLLGPAGGWVAAGVLLGIPIVPLWGTLAYVDMIHALYELLAVWGILRWQQDQRPHWLLLSAVMAGIALGTKVMALFLLPAFCLWLALLARRQGWLRAAGTAAAYGLLVCLVASPWYLFNLIALGDPAYPFLNGGAEWPPARVLLHLDYLRSFGAGRSLADFLLLPWNLYFRHEAFAALMQSIEYPSFLFPLALLLPVISLSPQARPLAGLAVLRLATWYLGSQQTRFLLPLYPVWALMVAAVLLGIEQRLHFRLAYPRVTGALTAGLVITTLVYVAIYTIGERPVGVVLGLESRKAYLSDAVYDYRALDYVVSGLPRDARVLQLWDGQSYYCDARCIPDAGQVQGPFLHNLARTVDDMRAELEARGVTHLLIDLEGLNFLLLHDPKGTHMAAARFFLTEFVPACGQAVYQDSLVRIYRLTCTAKVSAG